MCHSRNHWHAHFSVSGKVAPHTLNSRCGAHQLLAMTQASATREPSSQGHPGCGKWHHCHPPCTQTMGRGLFAGGLAWIAFLATTVCNDHDGSSGTSRKPSCDHCCLPCSLLPGQRSGCHMPCECLSRCTTAWGGGQRHVGLHLSKLVSANSRRIAISLL